MVHVPSAAAEDKSHSARMGPFVHGNLLTVVLFVSFETAWKAVKEFIETDGKRRNQTRQRQLHPDTESCRRLPRMLPPGATLKAVLPDGTIVPFAGVAR